MTAQGTKCDYCGKDTKVTHKESKHHFCNRECYLAGHSRNIKYTHCQNCGKKLSKRSKTTKYCSVECYMAQHQIKNKERICPVCQQEFTAIQSEDIYCSKECYNKDRHMPSGENHHNGKGGISKINDKKDSGDYKNGRKQVYERDNGTCQHCKTKGSKINAHHLYSGKHYPELRYEVDNGITLCEKCHILLHQTKGYDTPEKIGFD